MLAEDIQLKTKIIRGLETAWLEFRPKQPKGILVFLHGFPDHAEHWSEQLNYFKDQSYILIAPFSRGVGPSETPKALARYGSQSQSLDMKTILNEVDAAKKLPLWFVGHDLGVVYAWYCTRFFQKMTKGLIVINGLNLRQMRVRLKNPVQLSKSWYMLVMQVPKIPEMISQNFSDKVLRLAHFLGNSPSKVASVEENKNAGLAGIPQYRAFLREMVGQVMQRHPRVKCPVLVLWGKNDNVLLPPSLDEMEKDATKPIVRMLEAGHWVHREKAAEVNKLVHQFIKECEAKT